MTNWWHFSYFSPKIGFDISYKLSPLETICMKCQNLFWRKIRQMFFKFTLKGPLKTAADDILKYFILLFLRENKVWQYMRNVKSYFLWKIIIIKIQFVICSNYAWGFKGKWNHQGSRKINVFWRDYKSKRWECWWGAVDWKSIELSPFLVENVLFGV